MAVITAPAVCPRPALTIWPTARPAVPGLLFAAPDTVTMLDAVVVEVVHTVGRTWRVKAAEPDFTSVSAPVPLLTIGLLIVAVALA